MTGDAHLPHPGAPLTLGAVVLAGGGGARMGGVDKASIEVDGVTLLERTLAAVMAAGEVVVVGSEQVPTSRPVTWTREEPPGGGPAAGLLAGLCCFARPPQVVAVTAVDMPRLNAGTIARLTWAVEASPDVDAAVLRDAGGRRQWLAAVYRWSALQAARPADPAAEHGLPMHRLVAALRVVEVAAVGEEARDVDTLADLAALRDPGNHPTGDITR